LTDEDLASVWDAVDSEVGALRLLAQRGLSPEWPLYRYNPEGMRQRQAGRRNRWSVRAANLIPGLMELPTDPGRGQEPDWRPFEVTEGHYRGDVFSLDVERWHHYVSGGAITGNSVYVFPDLSQKGWQHGHRLLGGEMTPEPSLRRLFYVAFTRAREKLVICSGDSGFQARLPQP
jgi:hypothetical protein